MRVSLLFCIWWIASANPPYANIVYRLNRRTAVPGWFKIDTPLGSYNPDWAVLVNQDDEEKLYFVVETKGSILGELLRPSEKAKIDCGREHFKALEVPVKFMVADNFETFMDQVAG